MVFAGILVPRTTGSPPITVGSSTISAGTAGGFRRATTTDLQCTHLTQRRLSFQTITLLGDMSAVAEIRARLHAPRKNLYRIQRVTYNTVSFGDRANCNVRITTRGGWIASVFGHSPMGDGSASLRKQ